jgi:DNA-binding XRE family transcriptional regulator
MMVSFQVKATVNINLSFRLVNSYLLCSPSTIDKLERFCIISQTMQTATQIKLEISPPKLLRARGKRSRDEVAGAVGITRQHLWLIETGKSRPSAEIVARLCCLYGVEIRDLVRKA